MGAKWWTDGLRLVMELSDESTPLENQSFFYWTTAQPDSEEFLDNLRELMEEEESSDLVSPGQPPVGPISGTGIQDSRE